MHCLRLLTFVATLWLLASCTSNPADTVNPITNKWTIGPDEYTSVAVTDTLNTITASTGVGTTRSSITFVFTGDTLPATGGKYRVISGLLPNLNEMSFITYNNTAGKVTNYASYGLDSLYATIVVSSGKVTVKMPSVRAKNVVNAKDSVQVSANIQEF